MTVKVVSPALQIFGSEVRRYRELMELSQDGLAAKVPVSGSYVGSVERGWSRCTRAFAMILDGILDSRGAIPALWDKLVKNSAFPTWFDWPSVEEDADTLQSYECLVVPGLLQTPEYALTLLKGDKDAADARIDRQAILLRDDPQPPRLTIVLFEGVLHHQVGTHETMRNQLLHLIESQSERVAIQIVAGQVPPEGADGSFVLATMHDRSEVAYVETAARGLTLDEVGDIRTLTVAFDAIRARALPVDMSTDLIRRVIEERWT